MTEVTDETTLRELQTILANGEGADERRVVISYDASQGKVRAKLLKGGSATQQVVSTTIAEAITELLRREERATRLGLEY